MIAQAQRNSAYEDEALEFGTKELEALRQPPQALTLADDHHAVTISENISKGVLVFSFEDLEHQEAPSTNVQCPIEHFDSLCREQPGLTDSAQVDAALQQLVSSYVKELDWLCLKQISGSA